MVNGFIALSLLSPEYNWDSSFQPTPISSPVSPVVATFTFLYRLAHGQSCIVVTGNWYCRYNRSFWEFGALRTSHGWIFSGISGFTFSRQCHSDYSRSNLGSCGSCWHKYCPVRRIYLGIVYRLAGGAEVSTVNKIYHRIYLCNLLKAGGQEIYPFVRVKNVDFRVRDNSLIRDRIHSH